MEMLWTQIETAKFLRAATKTLERWRWEGNGPPYVKVGHKVLYRPEDVEAFIKKHVYRSTSEATKRFSTD